MIRMLGLFVILAALALPAIAMDESTVYDLLQPESHQFAIQYDTATDRSGESTYYNIIRPGSEATNEKVIDRATGKELPYEAASGKEAKKDGWADPDTKDETHFIRVRLPRPVPQNGEFRLRILKTYKDAKSYYADPAGAIVFERSLGIKRNIVILPAGYELIGCSVPAMVDTQDGRIRISMVNDRDDELQVRIMGRKLPAKEMKP
jgi:hypothetical protein